MKKKIVIFVFIVSVLLNIVIMFTFGYLWASEKAGKKSEEKETEFIVRDDMWLVSIELDVSELDPHAVQYAFFDHDPIPGFVKRVKGGTKIYFALQERGETEKQKHKYRLVAFRRSWDDAFADLSGDKVYLLSKGGAMSSNAPPAKQWIVTKMIDLDNEPLCWCISVQPEFGKVLSIRLNKDNAYNVSEEFDKAINVGLAKQETQYPADPNFKDEPKAHKLYDKMIKTFQNAHTIYYESKYWFGQEGMELREATYRVWLKKPNFARMEGLNKNVVTGTLVGNGEDFWIYWGDKNVTFEGEDFESYGNTTYMLIPSPQGHHSLAHMANKLKAGMSMLTFQPSRFHGGKSSLDEYLDGVRGLGTEIVNGVVCDVIEISFMKNQRSQFYWVSQKDHLPRKMMEIVRVDFTLIIQEVWSNVFTNIKLPNSLFSWEPPEGWTQYIEPDWQDNLLKPGTEAPDFELKTIEKRTVKLSDLKGKVVLLNFWRVGCPPCREEIVHLEDIHQKYKDTGLVIISINSSDDYDMTLNFLKDNNITYPNVVDASSNVQDLHHRVYEVSSGRSAVPMNYIIGRDGKIVEAWYGFHEDDEEESVLNKLKPLGFE